MSRLQQQQTKRKHSQATNSSMTSSGGGGGGNEAFHLVLPFTILINPSMVFERQSSSNNNSGTPTNNQSTVSGGSAMYSKFKASPTFSSSSSPPVHLSSSPSIQSLNSNSVHDDMSSLDSVSCNNHTTTTTITTNNSHTNGGVNNARMTMTGGNGDKQIGMQLQWLDIMKQEFLRYTEKEAKLSSEMELKMLFLEHFYDPISEKVPIKIFKSVHDVLQRLDLFCARVLKWLVPEDWIEIEKLKTEQTQSSALLYFYSKQLALKLETSKLFQHEYLQEFIQEQSKVKMPSPDTNSLDHTEVQTNGEDSNNAKFNENVTSEEDISVVISIKPKSSNNETISPSKDSGNESTSDDPLKLLLEHIKLISNMFSLELGDWFNFFEFKKRKKFKKWFESGLKNQCVPKYVLEIYKRKKDSTEKAAKEFNFKNEDLNQKHIIESDWYYTNWISKQHTDDWYVTYSDMPNVVQWNSDVDRSVEKLGLKNTKIIGYLNYPVSQVVKSNHDDEHLRYLFGDVNWYSFTPINMAHSIHKYPHALMVTTFKFGPFFSAREIQNVFSAKSSFMGNRMTGSSILFKSSDYLNNTETKDLIKVPFIGGRLFNMVDKNRTRYIEIRTINVGGLLGKKLLYSNPLTSKKLCLQNYQGVLKAVKDNEKKGHPLPSPEVNYLAKLLDNYCKVYCNIDLSVDEIL